MLQNIVLDFIESDIVSFFGNYMDVLGADPNNINLNDLETVIIHAKCMAWHKIDLNRIKQKINASSMALKKCQDWCVPEDEKKGSTLKTRTLFY